MRERIASGYIVDKQSTRSSTVVGTSDGLERFLSGCVPDLEFDVFLCNLDGSSAKLDANGQIVLLSESLVSKLKKQAGLADPCSSERDLPVSPMIMYLNK